MTHANGDPISVSPIIDEEEIRDGDEQFVEGGEGDGEQRVPGGDDGPGDDEEELFGDDKGEENDAVRVMPSPSTPTKTELEEHRATHLPYRSWCPDCVAGKAKSHPHSLIRDEGRSTPTIGFDYFFLNDPNEDALNDVKFLCIKERESKIIFAHAVPCKGCDSQGFVIEQICADVRKLGMKKIIIKHDQEPALVNVVHRALQATNITALFEESPIEDKQANGMIERGVQTIKGQLRVMKLGLERRINKVISDHHPIISWMTEHAAWLVNRFEKGHDGRTPFERLYGKKSRVSVTEFGEKIMYRMTNAQRKRRNLGVLGPRWRSGIWLGARWGSNEYLLYDEGEVLRARDVKRLPEGERWDADLLEHIDIFPWGREPQPQRPEQEGQPAVIFEPRPPQHDEPEVEQDRPVIPRAFNIRRTDLEKYGYTKGCRKCDCIRQKIPGEGGSKAHSEECRNRIAEEMMKDERAARRIQAAQERRQFFERRGEQGHEARMEDEEPRMEAPAPPTPQVQDPAEEGSSDSSSDSSDSSSSDSSNEDMGADEHETGPCYSIDVTKLEAMGFDIGSDLREIAAIIDGWGGLGKKHAEACIQTLTGTLSEIYSPDRVTHAAKMFPKYNVAPGVAMDLTTTNPEGESWDFTKAHHRAMARDIVEETKPLFLVGSPPCTFFSILQGMNKWRWTAHEIKRKYVEAMTHLLFVCELYKLQHREGRFPARTPREGFVMARGVHSGSVHDGGSRNSCESHVHAWNDGM